MKFNPTNCGWSNYETWAVHLWLVNEQDMYCRWRGRARQLLAEPESVADRDAVLLTLGTELYEAVETECFGWCDEPLHALFADLARAALEEVYWRELAEWFVQESLSVPLKVVPPEREASDPLDAPGPIRGDGE